MTIHFYLKYHTSYGQQIHISGLPGIDGNEQEIPLGYLNEEYWYVSVHIPAKQPMFSYRYIIRSDGDEIMDGEKDRTLDPSAINTKEITVFDTWNEEGYAANAFYTKPFRQILPAHEYRIPETKKNTFTHEFRIKAPIIKPGEWICITGSGKSLKNWDIKKPVPLQQDNNWFSIRLNLSKDDFPVRYKYGIYNTKSKSLSFEEGSDRILQSAPVKKHVTVLHDGLLRIQRTWRGAGVAIPVFSLRSNSGFGTGEFNDIKLLADWASSAGLRLIQLLPVNDTTATHTSKDSYPYAAISAFALHPLFINLESVAGKNYRSLLKPLSRKKKIFDQQTDLDYEPVMNEKLSLLKVLFDAMKSSLEKDKDFIDFFKQNKDWLLPYAVYCYLRDKFGTADFSKWKDYSVYDKGAVEKLASPAQQHYNEIAFHYFVQYHLHVQLKDASNYAHKKGVILKGDIPIGVSRMSCDVWVQPDLYNLDMQAGAPPDDFAVKGQNWGFPTYNWKAMQLDDYAWWKRRFAQMGNYFDSFRIDHILGFFRIWSIPVDSVEGIMGRFVPAIPVHISEFHRSNTWFDRNRYCKPYITDEVLEKYFGEAAAEVKEKFLFENEEGYELKENFNTQVKVEKNLKDDDIAFREGLFNLISNVILFEETNTGNPDKFHFRISMHKTESYQSLDPETQQKLTSLYNDYFFRRQDDMWKKEAMQKLPALKRTTNMLICGEDLGMVPHCVPEVMKQTGILTLEIQRMPKDPNVEFFHPRTAPYLSVVTPSTHDMSTVREWWEEDAARTQKFYNYVMGHYGKAPDVCEPSLSKDIFLQHIYSPAMWSIFQLQDLLGMNAKLRRADPKEERINQPADPEHYWKYRMHLHLEDLVRSKEFHHELRTLLEASGRA